MPLYNQPIYKQPSETLLVDMSFSNKLREGETILAIDSVVTSDVDLVVETQTITAAADTVELLISGGSLTVRTDIEEREYIVTVIVSTSASQILENEGIIIVCEKPRRSTEPAPEL